MSFKQKVTSCAVHFSLQRRPYTIVRILIHSWKQMCLYSFISEFFLLWALQHTHSWAACCRMSGTMTASSIIQQINFIKMTWGIWAFVSEVRPIVLQNFHHPSPAFSSRDVSDWLLKSQQDKNQEVSDHAEEDERCWSAFNWLKASPGKGLCGLNSGLTALTEPHWKKVTYLCWSNVKKKLLSFLN